MGDLKTIRKIRLSNRVDVCPKCGHPVVTAKVSRVDASGEVRHRKLIFDSVDVPFIKGGPCLILSEDGKLVKGKADVHGHSLGRVIHSAVCDAWASLLRPAPKLQEENPIQAPESQEESWIEAMDCIECGGEGTMRIRFNKHGGGFGACMKCGCEVMI